MFEYFPSNYPWNLTVAVSIAMGGEMSEIADACRPLGQAAAGAPHAAATEAWFQSWTVLAQRLQRLAGDAERQGRSLSAGEYHLRAANYHLVAERVMGWADPRRLTAYRHAQAAFARGCALSGHGTERVEVVNGEGRPLAGYLRLPTGSRRCPVLIFFNGFDSIKEMHYLLYAEVAARRGVGVLFIDQEGTGEALRLHDTKKRVDAEASAAPFIDYLARRDDVDSERIGVAGISNGGYDAPRAAAFDERLKCVACLGAFYNADDYMGRFAGGGADKVVHGLSDLDDHMMKVMGADEVEKAYRLFAERSLEGVLEQLRVPLLVVHGENDRQVPLWHADRTVREAVNSPHVDYKVFSLSEGGAEHCGIDNARLQANYMFDWVARVLG